MSTSRRSGDNRREPVPVVTGFIGSTEDGRTTTIGRNGSDYTAAIIGAALGASIIEIWTDVDGVLSADPKAVSSAFVLPQITYEEALEMSYFGAKVLHAGTIGPAVAKSIPILIKNTFNPAAAGTLITRAPTNGYRPVKGVSSVGDLTLLTLRDAARGRSPRDRRTLVPNIGVERRERHRLFSSHLPKHTTCLAVSTSEVAEGRGGRRAGIPARAPPRPGGARSETRSGDRRRDWRGHERTAGRRRERSSARSGVTTSASTRSCRDRRSATSRAWLMPRSSPARST